MNTSRIISLMNIFKAEAKNKKSNIVKIVIIDQRRARKL